MDKLGRNAIDVNTTVAKLEKLRIRVHCLTLVCVLPIYLTSFIL